MNGGLGAQVTKGRRPSWLLVFSSSLDSWRLSLEESTGSVELGVAVTFLLLPDTGLLLLDMLTAQACNPSNWKAEAGGLPQV